MYRSLESSEFWYIAIIISKIYVLPAIFKQRGYEVKELPEEDLEPLIDCRGTLKVSLLKQVSILELWQYFCDPLLYFGATFWHVRFGG